MFNVLSGRTFRMVQSCIFGAKHDSCLNHKLLVWGSGEKGRLHVVVRSHKDSV